ncbi:hypothetical protein OPFAMLBM_00025 [Aeromonas phage avDM12-TAAL]|nr:hypothetical protein OPFAMLBM_00025 [Aeromonas phage avDM12-TAAL]
MPFIVMGGGSGGSGGSLVIPNDLRFASVAERDTFFTNNASRLVDDVIVLVTTGPGQYQLFQYKKNETAWKEITAAIVGAKGDKGKDALNVKAQYSVDGTTWVDAATNTTKYIRTSIDDGTTWTPAFKIVSDEVVYQYSPNGTDQWADSFDVAQHKYARLSIDEGKTWNASFKISADEIVYQYGESEIGPWSLEFNKDLRPWGRISIDSGKNFSAPFRFVAQDGLSFIAQYSASELGPWTSFFVDGVHEYVRFSNDNQNTWTPAQRFKAVPFGVNQDDRNIIDLGGHKIISNNENIAFRNIFTGDNFYPVWQGISNDGSAIYRAAEVMFSERVNRQPFNGDKGATSVPYNFTRAYPTRMAILRMAFVPTEDFVGDIKFQLWSQGGLVLIYSQTMKNAELVNGREFVISYQGNLFVQPGNILNVRVVKADGTPVQALAGSTVATEPWRVVDYMPMEPVRLINEKDGKDVARMLETLQGAERLSINSLKDVDQIKVGSLRGDIDFNRDLSQFVPSTKNDYWKSTREINYGGLAFKIGDKLIAMRNIAANETITTLVDPNTFYLERNLANVAKPAELGLVMPGRNTLVSATGELYVRPATAENDGAVKLGVPGGAAKLGEDGKVSVEQLPPIDTLRRVSVNDEAARLALPVANRFTIAIQIDTQDQWYLDAFLLPSIKANWVYGGSVAANVSSFNNRNGNVLPQAGDYTADMVGALAKPATNDGKRRVVVGDKLVEEAIKQDEILDTATNITYVLKIEAGVPYLDPTNSEDV